MTNSSRLTRATFGVLVAAVGAGFIAQPRLQAYPAYKTKEGVGCTYCHVNPGGPRNYRGRYYKKNQLSFAGFDDAAVAVASGKEVLPSKGAKPTSLTTPTPITDAYQKTVVAKEALAAKTDDPALSKAYVESLTGYSAALFAADPIAVPAEPRFTEIIKVSDAALAADPKNTQAAADKAKAEAGLKAAKEAAAKAEAEKVKAN